MCIDEGNEYLKRSRPDVEFGNVINVKSIQNLLDHWGFKYLNNKSRPYINGHEREDVVAVRKDFVHFFAANKENYYFYEKNEDLYGWKYAVPSESARIKIAYDESTIRSGKLS